MLFEASLWIANQDFKTIVTGRNVHRLERLDSANKNISPLVLDYSDFLNFKKQISQLIQSNGHFDLIAAWIHGDPKNLIELFGEINQTDQAWQLHHVMGSASDLASIKKRMNVPSNCQYYQIQLGFKIEHKTSRWLYDHEISNGLIDSIKSQTDVLVGQLEPWEQRP